MRDFILYLQGQVTLGVLLLAVLKLLAMHGLPLLHDPSSFYLIVCLFYQMDSGWHHNIYVRVHSSTGLSCMYLWCRQHINWVLGWTFRCSNLTLWTMFIVKLFVCIAQWCAIVRPTVHWQRVLHSRMMQLFKVFPAQQSIHKISNFRLSNFKVLFILLLPQFVHNCKIIFINTIAHASKYRTSFYSVHLNNS